MTQQKCKSKYPQIKYQCSSPRLTYGEMIQRILTSTSDSVEENHFNSNETPLLEVVTNSKDRRVKLFYLYLFIFCSKSYFEMYVFHFCSFG